MSEDDMLQDFYFLRQLREILPQHIQIKKKAIFREKNERTYGGTQ